MISLQLPGLYEKQKQIIYAPERYSVCVSGTKTGKTLGCSIWISEKACNNAKSICWWVAPVYRQTQIGFGRCRDLLCPEIGVARESDLTIHLKNGSVIEFRSAEKDSNLYGEAVDYGVLDEADRMRAAAWYAYRSTITQTKAPTRFMSNPVHSRSWFRELWENKGNDPQIYSSKLTTYDNEYIDKAEIEDAKVKLPESIFRSLYLAEWPESGGMVFRGLNRCLTGQLRGYEGRFERVMGIDLGRKEDWTVLTVMDKNEKELVDWDRFKELSWNIQKKRIEDIWKKNGNPDIVMESNGIGDPIAEELRELGMTVIGVQMTNKVKNEIIDLTRVAVEQQLIKIPNIEVLVDEMETFECNISPAGNLIYSAPEGYHDDCPMSLALAVWGMRSELRDPVVKADKTVKTIEQMRSEEIWKSIRKQTKHAMAEAQGAVVNDMLGGDF